jgi:hypothetical protein
MSDPNYVYYKTTPCNCDELTKEQVVSIYQQTHKYLQEASANLARCLHRQHLAEGKSFILRHENNKLRKKIVGLGPDETEALAMIVKSLTMASEGADEIGQPDVAHRLHRRAKIVEGLTERLSKLKGGKRAKKKRHNACRSAGCRGDSDDACGASGSCGIADVRQDC